MIRIITVTALALATLSPAMAKDKQGEPLNPDKKICRFEAPTGTIMRKRVCHTAAEWSAIDSAGAKQAGQMMGRANTMGSPLGTGQ
ncbi:hypothetical protein QUC32_16585 [Novosphingobium resinovorum]|jgi:hypothetical protein|uniref:Uncharacterized protein n=1 Tax=Novosphingobium resinovorum TaxID=158500 RepID=A0A031K8J4_9SPHN|nr:MULTISPECIES: hypothetical protein [Novosphingobium]AOR75909.1 hypothetical protein BES08_03460 [Novosphingobium resinovorum]EZP84917.1 hypothetical protein BV97_00680 [Novosphingobium resinovorum]MBF7011283.1 hypothetical protein [Novosphingobium sp. HR1a]WJM29265.1 hypothetical protein QUC32_16585 [Novosphingobium resinovorum]